MATFVGNRSIKRLAQEDYEVITGPSVVARRLPLTLFVHKPIETTPRRFFA